MIQKILDWQDIIKKSIYRHRNILFYLIFCSSVHAQPIIELGLYKITDTTGIPNSSTPGVEKFDFNAGDTIRITLSATNTGTDVDIRVILNIRAPNDSTIVYDSYIKGEDSHADTPLELNETDYYSFDWTLPENASGGFYDIASSIRNLDNFAIAYKFTGWINNQFLSLANNSIECFVHPKKYSRQLNLPDKKVTWKAVDWGFQNGLTGNNVHIDNNGELILQANQGSGVGAQIETAANFHYGRYTIDIKSVGSTVSPEGVAQGFFYYSDNPSDTSLIQEIDVEILSAKHGFVYYTIHFSGNNSVTFRSAVQNQDIEFHQYGFDWEEDRVTFILDGETALGYPIIPGGSRGGNDQLLSSKLQPVIITSNMIDIPSRPGAMFINIWSGSAFSGDAPQGKENMPMTVRNINFQPGDSKYSYSNWIIDNFKDIIADDLMTLSDTITDPKADPDQDGLNNMMEYFLGLNPAIHNNEKLFSYNETNGDFTIMYQRWQYAINVNATIEWSSDLTNWSIADFSNYENYIRCSDNVHSFESMLPLSSQNNFKFTRLKLNMIDNSR